MQQRSTTGSSRAPEENFIVKVTQPMPTQLQPKYSPRNSIMTYGSDHQLPVYFRSSNPIRKLASEKLVHAIPFAVLLCLFTLWWFSYPVNLVIKDGKIVAVHRVEMPQPLNNNHVEFAILASATAPVAAVPHNITVNNEAEVHPVGKMD
ncbi:uncharacterized protein LOC8271707 [Ricinus communis]|uniref:uncharacterized protein LOC8271707 n=1 Tax=Ricinus communis TaxID=3988 RepID=UPI000772C6B2|nr:uncharacterized protein LOC8271707 [Ricinus communis]|eukprot:XP_015582492.1 uncharacterized protein LOC8271707 [Ricinus communis]